MQAFEWNSRFETGIASVDEQHRKLVNSVNLLGGLVISGEVDRATLAHIFGDLSSYATSHFADEERLMQDAGMDPAAVEEHRLHHRQFVEQLMGIWKGRAELTNPVEMLHGYLSSWLTFHILDEDHSMARQIAMVAQGVPAAQAREREIREADNTGAVLSAAMQKLYQVLAMQNRGLVRANTQLEEQVAERSRELLQSEKMAAVGQLAAGVAHEINNPIGFVNSNLGMLRTYSGQLMDIALACAEFAKAHPQAQAQLGQMLEKADLPYLQEDLQALLKESQEGLDRVKHIVQSLKDFAHPDTGEMVDFDLLNCLESTLNVVWNEIKYKAEVVRELQPVALVRCVPGQINQVFMNLLVNAAHAIEKRGTITLRSGQTEDKVWVEITDTGCGMTEDVRKRVFEPFFTTKPVGKGTGLGLSISWDIIVNKHGGAIDLKSEPGVGSTFRLSLPIRGHNAA